MYGGFRLHRLQSLRQDFRANSTKATRDEDSISLQASSPKPMRSV